MATTTNFGWATPNDTDFVKDGAAAIRTLGSSIDTSFVDLKGGTTGQILAKASNTDLDYSWITNDVGDITAVTAGTGLTGGGTTGAVSLAIDSTVATLTGSQTLTNKTLTSPVLTTPTISNIDAKGDLLAGTADNTIGRLAVGTNGQVLTADSSTGTGLAWATAASSDLVRITTSSFSASSAVNVDSCFSSTYDNYLVLMNVTSSSSTNAMNFRFRTGGTTNTTSNYGSGWTYNAFGTSGATGNLGSAAGSNIAYIHDITGGSTYCAMTVHQPFASTITGATFSVAQSNGYHDTGALTFNLTTSFDGLSFISAAGTITGTISIYGYKKA
jgi:hypothetical protein